MRIKQLSGVMLLLCWISLSKVQATTDTTQTTPAKHYRIRSSGAGIITIKDRFLSPLLYQGITLGSATDHIRQSSYRLQHFRYLVQTSFLINGVNDNLMPALQAGIEYGQHFRLAILTDAGIHVYAGGLINSTLLFKACTGNINNVVSYDGMAALHASGMLQYKFVFLKIPFELFYQADVPLAGILLRPEYSWPVPYPVWEAEGGQSQSLQFASWHNYRRIRTRTSLDFNLTLFKRTSHWRTGYAWDYSRTDRLNPSQFGSHIFTLGRIFTL